ncbi:MAG: MerR family transcriptional regulator [Bacteroidetes bacterium]|nr:MerR family transcriptional regulator [Bacteroidota bacterium]MCH8247340.1 MerR family transcriptional regulator [Bacteroidota bacterium]
MLDSGITKLYYTISEVADMVKEEPHVLRYWETEFVQIRPKKNRGGKRIYTQDDIDTVFRIRHLLRDDKYTIEGARQALSKRSKASSTNGAGAGELMEVRGFLERVLERVSE